MSHSWRDYEEITANVIVDADDLVEDYDGPSFCKCSSFEDKSCSSNVCYNYATLTECTKCTSYCGNNKFQKNFSVNLDVREASDKGFGLYCLEDITKGQFVREYVGELISTKELNTRLRTSATDHMYVMELKSGTYLDARRKGSVSRFINHSCEPNCSVEVWTVGRRLRVGIFAIKDISANTELTFDYRWERSERPLTRCCCGTKSCRGYLEVLSEEDLDDPTLTLRSGLWTKSVEAERLAEESGKGGEWLVGRRIKVWWEENQSYFEADVLSYSSSTLLHFVKYLTDNDRSYERLLPCSSSDTEWEWLDEEKNDVIIRKRKVEDDDGSNTSAESASVVEEGDEKEREERACDTFHLCGHTQRRRENRSSFVSAAVGTSSTTIKVTYAACAHVLSELNQSANLHYFQRSPAQILGGFCEWAFMKLKVQVRCLDESKTTYSEDDVVSLYFHGMHETVTNLCNKLEKADEFCRAEKVRAESERKALQRSQQSASMTNDWRCCLPSDVVEQLCCAAGCSLDRAMGSIKGLLPHNSLPLVPTQQDIGVQRSMRQSLCLLLQEVKATERTSFHALTLLQRCFDVMSSADITSDLMGFLAACLLLSIKSVGVFRPWHICQIISSAYKVIFHQVLEESVPERYIRRTSIIEHRIMQNLQCDLLVPDISYFCLPVSFDKGVSCDDEVHAILQGMFVLCNCILRAGDRNVDVTGERVTVSDVYRSLCPDLLQWNTVFVLCVLQAYLMHAPHQRPSLGEVNSDVIAQDTMIRRSVMENLSVSKTFLPLRKAYIRYSRLSEHQTNSVAIYSPFACEWAMHMLCLLCKTALNSEEVHSVQLAVSSVCNSFSRDQEITQSAWKDLLTRVPCVLSRWCREMGGTSQEYGHLGHDYHYSPHRHPRPPTAPPPPPPPPSSDGCTATPTLNKLCLTVRVRQPYNISSNRMHTGWLDYSDMRIVGRNQKRTSNVVLARCPDSALRAVNAGHLYYRGVESVDDTSTLVALLPMPLPRALQSEVRRIASAYSGERTGLNCDDFGVSPSFLRELLLIQHVTYFSDAPERGLYEGIVPPIAVARKQYERTNCADRENKTTSTTYVSSPATFTPTLTVNSRSSPRIPASSPCITPLSTITSIDSCDSNVDSVMSLLSSLDSYQASGSAVDPITPSIARLKPSPVSNNRKDHRSAGQSIGRGTPTPNELYYAVLPAPACHLPLADVVSSMKGEVVDVWFLRDLCRDLIQAMRHCSSRGVEFRYISMDQLWLSSTGRITLCGLAGAVWTRSKLTTADSALLPPPETTNRKISKHIMRPPSLGQNIESASPEVIYGEEPSEHSSVWTAAAICCFILSGSMPIKLSTDENKYVQHMFALLGTPLKMGYTGFSSLPRAKELGSTVLVKGSGEKIQVKSRLVKMLLSSIVKRVQCSFAYENDRKNLKESFDNSVVYALSEALQLVPSSRPSFDKFINMEFFTLPEPDHVERGLDKMINLTTSCRKKEWETVSTDDLVNDELFEMTWGDAWWRKQSETHTHKRPRVSTRDMHYSV